MLDKCEDYKFDRMCLKKPSALQKVIESVPKPKGAVPDFGLPKWGTMTLDAKIPMVPGHYNFTRGRVGKNVWIRSPEAEFNLSDPYCREIKQDYDSLHDENLARFFACPRNKKFLVKVGLLTEKYDVKCSLKDYNMYRRYLRKLHCDSVKKVLRKRARLQEESRILRFAEDEAQKEIRKLRKKQKISEANKKKTEKKEAEEKEKNKRLKETEQRMNKRLLDIEMAKKEEQLLKRARKKEREQRARQRLTDVAKIRRRRLMEILIERRKKDLRRMRNMETQLAKKREEKRKLTEERWNKRQEFQKKQMEKEKFLLACANQQHEQFLKQYNQKVAKERQRMQRLLKNVKTFVTCYLGRHLTPDKERICCKKYLQHAEERKRELKRLMCSLDPSITAKDLEMFLKEYENTGDVKTLPQHGKYYGDGDDSTNAKTGKDKSTKATKTEAKNEEDRKPKKSAKQVSDPTKIPEKTSTIAEKVKSQQVKESKEICADKEMKTRKCRCELTKSLTSK